MKTAPGRPLGATKLDLGVTLNHKSLRDGGNPVAVLAGTQFLKASGNYVNIFIIGLGTRDPEPLPGQFDWTSLDTRVAMMRRTQASLVLTLCCAPGWMRGEEPGEENWKKMFTTAPYAEHFDDYADLARRIAMRYPDIKYFQVWSEFKGFRGPRRWQLEAYTNFYNKIYDALKSASSDIKVGGPYVPMVHWLGEHENLSTLAGPYGAVDSLPLQAFGYWLQHKHGADFISIDGGTSAFIPLDERAGSPRSFGPDLFADTQIFTDTTKWVLGQTSLPVWWSEWYAAPNTLDDNEQAALMAAALIRFAPLVSVALKWSPEGDAEQDHGDQESLWTDTRIEGGGKALPFFAVVQSFRHCFPPGTLLIDVTSSSHVVAALSSRACTMLVNESEESITVSLNGKTIGLARFETRFVENH